MDDAHAQHSHRLDAIVDVLVPVALNQAYSTACRAAWN